jgi:predicted MFS family arabinose efflux permease
LDITQWRSIVVAAAAGAVLSSMLFAFVVREGPFQAPSAPFDPRAVWAVLGNRGVLLATGGYLGHMWELYAMWSSIGVFWAYVATKGSVSPSTATVLAFLTIAAGTVGSVVAGIAGDRVGRPVVTMVAMAISGTCAVVIGTLVSAPLVLLAAVAVLWGMSIVADSAQFSAAVTELAPGRYVGTAITVQTCLSGWCRSGRTGGDGSVRTFRLLWVPHSGFSQCGGCSARAASTDRDTVSRNRPKYRLPLPCLEVLR